MESNTAYLTHFLHLPDYGIVIPCRHNHTPLKLAPSTKKLNVKIFFNVIQTLVYYPTNGRRWVSTQDVATKKLMNNVNPFCALCRVVVARCLIESKRLKYNTVAARQYLDLLSEEVWNKVLLVKEHNSDDKEVVYEHINRLATSVQITDPRVGCEEEFMAWVAAGYAVKEEEIPIIKGLESVGVDDDAEFLEREDMCSICLQKLKIMDMEEDVDPEAATTSASASATDVGITTNFRSLVKLPCKHVFHECCVLGWLHKSHACPFCRSPVEK